MNYGYFHDHYISNVNDDTIKFIYTQSNEIFITSIKIRYDFLNDLCKQKLQNTDYSNSNRTCLTI